MCYSIIVLTYCILIAVKQGDDSEAEDVSESPVPTGIRELPRCGKMINLGVLLLN